MSNKNRIVVEKKIRLILSRTDWIVYNVENVFSQEQVEEAKVFRKGLRDMNKVDIESVNWIFPDTPDFINPLDFED